MLTVDTSIHTIILAGRGTRLQRITTALGEPREKQFCRLGGSLSLLQRTVERLQRITALERIAVITGAEHVETAKGQLQTYDGVSLVPQPEDRGTGIAVLSALLGEFRASHPELSVIAPADHAFADDELFCQTLAEAIELARRLHAPILIGASADEARTDCPWILPAGGTRVRLSRIARFIDKPSPDTATALLEEGGLFDTAVMVAPTMTLVDTFADAFPDVFTELVPAALLDGEQRHDFLRWAFTQVRSVDWRRHIVWRIPNAQVLALPLEAGWTDLGSEDRVLAWLESRNTTIAGRALSMRARRHAAQRAARAGSASFVSAAQEDN